MVPASRPQPILTPLTPAAIFLVATINDGGEQKVHDAFENLSGLVRAVGFRTPAAHLTLVTGIGSNAWDRLFAGSRPAKLHPFVELEGSRHHAPATPGDLLFHIRAESMDSCFELGGRILDAMAGAVTVVDEVHGFRFYEQRDLLGFVDGTENPDGPEAVDAVQIGQEDPRLRFGGASYVHVQKYTHDMTAWNALSVPEQERVIGRTKLEDIEFDDAVKPPNSHLALNVITDDDGNELQIVRANMPFGTLGDGASGTYYIALRRRSGRDRADAAQHVHRRSARQHRPDPGLLHRRHRQHVLRPHRGLPRQPSTARRSAPAAIRRPTVRGTRTRPLRRLTRHRQPERTPQ